MEGIQIKKPSDLGRSAFVFSAARSQGLQAAFAGGLDAAEPQVQCVPRQSLGTSVTSGLQPPTSGLQPPIPSLPQASIPAVCLNVGSARLRGAFEEVIDLSVVAKPAECSAHGDPHFLF